MGIFVFVLLPLKNCHAHKETAFNSYIDEQWRRCGKRRLRQWQNKTTHGGDGFGDRWGVYSEMKAGGCGVWPKPAAELEGMEIHNKQNKSEANRCNKWGFSNPESWQSMLDLYNSSKKQLKREWGLWNMQGSEQRNLHTSTMVDTNANKKHIGVFIISVQACMWNNRKPFYL